MASFSRPDRPSAFGYLGVPSLTPSPARRQSYSPPASPLGRFGPTPASLKAHATGLPFSKPARLRAHEPSRAFNRTRSPRQVQQQARMLSFSCPRNPSASSYLGVPSLSPSIVPAAGEAALSPPGPLGRPGPFSYASISSCHRAAIFPACPALRAPRLSRALNCARSSRQMRQNKQGCSHF